MLLLNFSSLGYKFQSFSLWKTEWNVFFLVFFINFFNGRSGRSTSGRSCSKPWQATQHASWHASTLVQCRPQNFSSSLCWCSGVWFLSTQLLISLHLSRLFDFINFALISHPLLWPSCYKYKSQESSWKTSCLSASPLKPSIPQAPEKSFLR